MVQGIKFLSKKGFNPQNLSNQKRVWEAEQRQSEERRQIDERQRQLQRERDDEEMARSRGETPKLGFLYDVPPGLQGRPSKEASSHQDDDDEAEEQRAAGELEMKPAALSVAASSTESNSLTESHPDDDEATAAFRKLLAGAAASANIDGSCSSAAPSKKDNESSEFSRTMAGKFGTVLRGTDYDAFDNNNNKTDKQKSAAGTALEKAVGGRKQQVALTLDEQIQRFPVLANAPRTKGMTATDIGVSFKPLGSQIRNVKCMACSVWGHSRGDRECRISGWDPFAATATTALSVSTTAVAAAEQVSKTDRSRAAHDGTTSSRRRRDDDSSDVDQKKESKRLKRRGDSDDSSNTSSEDSRRRHKRHKKKKRKDKRHHHHHKKSSSSKY